MARALVTGCASGIGRATAVELTRRGFAVVATARRIEDLEALEVEQHLVLDVTNDDSVAAALAAAGEIDVLVNSAGVSAWGPVEAVGTAVLGQVVGTNLFGTARVTAAALPGMRARKRGRIVNVSTAALRGFPLLGAYAASKAALEAWTETLRFEVAPFGITVALVEPGAVDTAFGANRLPVEVPPEYAAVQKRATEALTGMRSGTLSAEEVAVAVADVVALADPPLRTPVGEQAARILEERRTVDDATYEATIRQLLQDRP